MIYKVCKKYIWRATRLDDKPKKPSANKFAADPVAYRGSLRPVMRLNTCLLYMTDNRVSCHVGATTAKFPVKSYQNI